MCDVKSMCGLRYCKTYQLPVTKKKQRDTIFVTYSMLLNDRNSLIFCMLLDIYFIRVVAIFFSPSVNIYICVFAVVFYTHSIETNVGGGREQMWMRKQLF